MRVRVAGNIAPTTIRRMRTPRPHSNTRIAHIAFATRLGAGAVIRVGVVHVYAHQFGFALLLCIHDTAPLPHCRRRLRQIDAALGEQDGRRG